MTLGRTADYKDILTETSVEIIDILQANHIEFQDQQIGYSSKYQGAQVITFDWFDVDSHEEVLDAMQAAGFTARMRHSKIESHRVFYEVSRQLDDGLTVVVDLEFSITDPQPSAQFKVFVTHGEGGQHVAMADSDYEQNVAKTFRTERNKPVTESRTRNVLGKVIRRSLEAADAIPVSSMKNLFRKMVRDDLIAATLEVAPDLTQVSQGNRMKKFTDYDMGDFYLAFHYSPKDKRTNEQRVTEIGAALAKKMGFEIVDKPYPRRATTSVSTKRTVKQGSAIIDTPIWCQDLIQSLSKEYQNATGTIGYGFDVQLNATKKVFGIEVRFTGKAV